jgi:hypothetical protein
VDGQRLATCLGRLLRHVDAADVALTGSVALALHLPAARRAAGDLDLVARTMAAVHASVAGELLVSHHHVAQAEVPRAFLQLVDPETRLRIDVFPDSDGVVARARLRALAGGAWRVVAAVDLLAHKRQLLARASPERPVDEKHWRDAVALAAHLGAAPPPRPPHLGRDVYATELALACDRCARSRDPRFPLAGKRAIFDLLGYV